MMSKTRMKQFWEEEGKKRVKVMKNERKRKEEREKKRSYGNVDKVKNINKNIMLLT